MDNFAIAACRDAQRWRRIYSRASLDDRFEILMYQAELIHARKLKLAQRAKHRHRPNPPIPVRLAVFCVFMFGLFATVTNIHPARVGLLLITSAARR